MLSEIKRYLQQRDLVCLSDIALHLNSSPDAVRGMLETWIRKGRVRRQPANTACGSHCGKCAAEQMELYEWVKGGRDSPVAANPIPE